MSVLYAAIAAAQEPVPVFKSSVAVVPIGAVVVDNRGRTVTTLKASDFEVRDNGESRPIVSFQIDQTAPLTIAVLVDTSGSMRLESKLASARQVVAAMTGSLREGVDAVGMNPCAEAEGPAAVAEGAACLEFPDVALSQEIELACLRVEGV